MNKNTFKEEFAWLAQYLPEALGQDTGEGNSQNNFQDTLQTIIREIENTREDRIANTIDFINFPNEPEIVGWSSNEVSFESLFEAMVEMYNSKAAEVL